MSANVQNPQITSSMLLKTSTKALEKPLIEKYHHHRLQATLNRLKLSDQHSVHSPNNQSTLKLRKSLSKENKQQNYNQNAFISPKSILKQINKVQSQNFGSNKSLTKHKKRQSIFEQTFQSMYNTNNSTKQDQTLVQNNSSIYKWSQEKCLFNSTLKKFNDFRSFLSSENHSPKKETIQGAEDVFDSTKLMSITMRNFRTLQPSLKPRQQERLKLKQSLNHSLNLPQIYKVKEQLHLQKDKFFKMHPYLLKKQDSKSLQRRIDKRKNLLGLQELYIRMRNKQTKKIYKNS